MNFDLSEEQTVIRDLAAQLFGDLATTDRVKQVESEGGFDCDLWNALAEAGLLGVCLPEAAGGSGMDMVELVLICEQQGMTVAPVPIGDATVAAMTIAEHLPAETDLIAGAIGGSVVITTALAESGANNPMTPSVVASRVDGGLRLVGEKPAVPALPYATGVLVPASLDGTSIVALVDPGDDGVSIEPLTTTNHSPQGHLTLDTVVAEARIITSPDALQTMYHRQLVANSAVQLGVAAGSVKLAAEHVSTRQQFGRPLSAFQAVSQRAADGYILTEALRTTVLNAAWQLAQGGGATRDVLAAAYWASEGTQQIVLGSQHLHAGIGADVDYPVHRHFLWGMQLASTLGTASSHAADLGDLIADPR